MGLPRSCLSRFLPYPDAGRYWDMVDVWKITQFYTAPTAIRAIARMGDSFVEKYDRSIFARSWQCG